ncbi:pyridoxamine 5'-phosphate oxidase family protein [Algoriphagus sp.]|uniref:pyridoxamine 5'-phosphate oxidase family protein n=1 Tax=Algoriphagus sp. TaxID=1872435 RepID=UPI002612D846|nr:pyridoxamine 5'-phosphate oxidase family protein [Algoriphagus sp.]
MLFQNTDRLEEIWKAVKHELHRGALDVKHPFHWVNLGTVSGEFPSVRTLVLRKLTQELDFLFFTDYRSEKCRELRVNQNVTLHFYHPKKQVQIRVKAQSNLHFQNELAAKFWNEIPPHRRSEYTGAQAPGTSISHPQEGWEDGNSSDHFFSVLEFSPVEIEALQLRREGHLRVRFSKKADWEGIWLVP